MKRIDLARLRAILKSEIQGLRVSEPSAMNDGTWMEKSETFRNLNRLLRYVDGEYISELERTIKVESFRRRRELNLLQELVRETLKELTCMPSPNLDDLADGLSYMGMLRLRETLVQISETLSKVA